MSNQQRTPGEHRERFYQSVAETLALLHTSPGYDRKLALAEVAKILESSMDLPLVWIGRREPEMPDVVVVAAAGPAAAYATSLHLSVDEHRPGGGGPVAIALRERQAKATSIEAPEFAPWRERARRYGLGSCIVATSATRDGGQLVLAAYARHGAQLLDDDLLDWAQRLADELVRFWDHQALLERSVRMNRYRDAQRTIQRALLDQPDPEAVYRTLARALAEIAGAAAVDVHVVDDSVGAEPGMLRRVALVGPLAAAVRELPMPPQHSEERRVLTPTLVFMRGTPVVRLHPATHPETSEAWHSGPLSRTGAIGCWPLFEVTEKEAGPDRKPAGVFVIATLEADAFDAEMCRLLDEIAEATGLALRQHRQRQALSLEQERQTYLALHDDLTDLPNRRALDHYLEGVLLRAQRHDRMVAVGLLDLDDLKPVNDRHGHAAGDHVLVTVAERLCSGLRSTDYVARLGGDEFVLVLEELDSEDDLDFLLDRVRHALQQPMEVAGDTLQISASLGIAMFPRHAEASGEQLLRRADQAMYEVKSRKRGRSRWWSFPAQQAPADDPPVASENSVPPPYGASASAHLAACFFARESVLPALLDGFYAELLAHEGTAQLLGMLPADDLEAFRQRMYWHLETLVQPDLELATHRTMARKYGFFHAACGVEEVWLLDVMERLRDLFSIGMGATANVCRSRWPLSIVLQRLALDRQWQLESMRELQRRRVAVLAQLNALAWSAEGYLALIQGVVDTLVNHDEVIAVAVGRPDVSGELTYEAVAGEAIAGYLRALGRREVAAIRVTQDSTEGGGPSGRAWRTATIQRCVHYGHDPAMASWSELAMRLGVVSNIAIPLCPSPSMPAAVLTIYSPYPGGLQGEDQRAFVEQIKTVLDLALARMAPSRPGTELLPFFTRERWRAMIVTDALQMHYQPVVRLHDGRVTELEALARLCEGDGTLVPPGRFLQVLLEDDLILLFRQGLQQAVACREMLTAAGYALDMSVNAPAVALQDHRYAAVAAEVLAGGNCPAAGLLFEILESPIGTEHSEPLADTGMQALKALGVRLVEDDLGAGYSSLIRLRHWPFDRVKIDQALVRQVVEDPLRTLRFIRQLIRLGHDLGLEVVVEGLETAGLIEAALILGADLGQGYALARPMSQVFLLPWLAAFHVELDAMHPRTALGALAGALRWEEQFAALPADRIFWQQHARQDCATGSYLAWSNQVSPELLRHHAAMHEASVAGPMDPLYRHQREAFVSQMIEHVLLAERVQDRHGPVVA
ncbi:MAG: diguanylate cyclase [Rhodanobacter sp.]|nr:MAG: diguanylate cyclase [Rhodanobacter sp.]